MNIPWIDTGTKVVREVEHGGRFINISSTAWRVAQGISARCSMEAQCWGSILKKLQVKYFFRGQCVAQHLFDDNENTHLVVGENERFKSS